MEEIKMINHSLINLDKQTNKIILIAIFLQYKYTLLLTYFTDTFDYITTNYLISNKYIIFI